MSRAWMLGLVACASCASAPVPTPPPKAESVTPVDVGAKAPDFSVDAVRGSGKLSLAPNKVNLVVFWASWHGPSKKMFPELEELRLKYEAKGLAIVAISVEEERASVESAAKSWPGTFPIAWDQDHAIAKRYDMRLFPTLVIVDRNGVIRARHGGWREGDIIAIDREISALL